MYVGEINRVGHLFVSSALYGDFDRNVNTEIDIHMKSKNFYTLCQKFSVKSISSHKNPKKRYEHLDSKSYSEEN